MSQSIPLRLATLLTFAVLAQPAQSAIIFSNMPFGPDPVGVGAIPVPGLFLYSATNFTPTMDYRLTSLVLPLAVVSGPTEIDVLLLSDAGNNPGSVIEMFHLGGFPLAGPLFPTMASSLLQPILNGGTQYWVAVTGGTPTTFGVWGLTLFTGDPSAGGATRTINQGVDQGWTRNSGTRVGAVQLEGELVPEPAPIFLTTAAFVVFGILRKRFTS